VNKSPDGRFEILYNTRDDDSYMYSYSSFSFHVCSTEFGDEILSFSGRSDSDSSGTRESGTQSVRFDGDWVIARDADGKLEKVQLPSKIERFWGRLLLTWPDGRTERRERKEGLVHSKYGQPFSLKKLTP
jgi:hypothetical protein